MKNNQQLLSRKSKLQREERELIGDLDYEAQELEKNLKKSLTVVGAIAAGLAGGYLIYKLVSPSRPSPKVKTKIKSGPPKAASMISQSILTLALKSLLPIAIEKLSNKLEANDNEPTQSTGRK
ncbi:hypothetical protein N6H18_04015 [Reichenbachiella agarivorans]|uniref:YtxH-like protein n=1 Tax=Reichenbachiella agarivorans TaxID=2979464 RepID=A0ABY6CUS3_9BACT|nr:hypothetical protein [Reichenbachiella agarivorans]UXP33118.1 hypothetical protein N6H18_04015 [Reichenbachiella agarivorans]